MSSLVLPARSWLKPDRAWDVPRPAGNRHRSPWWRKLLGGRDGQTRLQPGSCCGCTGPTQSCGTCAFPETLYLTDEAGTVTLTYDGGLGGWFGCQTFSVSSLTVCQWWNGDTATSTHSMMVNYRLTYVNPSCQIIRQWYACNLSGTEYYCVDAYTLSTCTRNTSTCSGTPGVECQDSGQDVGNLANCTLPESVTLTLGLAGGIGTSIPSPFSSGSCTLQS